jgi:peroxiredoxin
MRSRWMVAAAAALGLGILALPLMIADRPGGESVVVEGAACKPQGVANLDLQVTDMHGATVNLADYKGKVVLLNFWATWCPPCRQEIPELVQLQEEYRDRGFAVLGVSTDDTPEQLREFAKAYNINYPSLLMQKDLEDAYGPLWALPTSFFIDRSGAICRTHMGPVTREQVEREIAPLL